MRARSHFRLLIVLVLCFSQVDFANAAQWKPEKPVDESKVVGWQINEELFPRINGSALFRANPSALCPDIGVSPCDDLNGEYELWLVLPRCDQIAQEWCINSLSIGPQDGTISEAKFLREIEGNKTSKNSSLGFPKGGSVSLWESSDSKQFAVFARVVMRKEPNEKIIPNELEVRIMPYQEIQIPDVTSRMSDASLWAKNQDPALSYCAWIEGTLCGEIQDFPVNLRAKLSLRVSTYNIQWISARLSNPEVTTKKITNNQSLLEVEGSPIVIPKFYAFANLDSLTSKMKSTIWPGRDRATGINQIVSGEMKSFTIIDAWKNHVNDSAAGAASLWLFRSQPIFEEIDRCFVKGKTYGIVATNAMVTDGSGFQFGIGSIEYRMAGLHLNSDGSVFKGSYELKMTRESAECQFGLDSSKISATIKVIENGVEQQLETASFKEGVMGGVKYLQFAAQGFTFSSPTIRITLKQTSSKMASKSATKKSIICTKGKTTKKVTGTNPKCPVGYKKK